MALSNPDESVWEQFINWVHTYDLHFFLAMFLLVVFSTLCWGL